MRPFGPRRTRRLGDGGRPPARGPVDLVAIAFDDAVLDRLAARSRRSSHLGNPSWIPGESGSAVPDMFADWQDRLAARPHPEPMCPERAAVLVASGHPQRAIRPAIAIAAAICALLVGSAVVGARSARPGDPLFPVTQVLWADQADAAVAGEQVRGAMDTARAELQAGRARQAATLLAQASIGLKRVSNQEEHAAIQQDLAGLWAALAAADPTVAAAAKASADVAVGESAGGVSVRGPASRAGQAAGDPGSQTPNSLDPGAAGGLPGFAGPPDSSAGSIPGASSGSDLLSRTLASGVAPATDAVASSAAADPGTTTPVGPTTAAAGNPSTGTPAGSTPPPSTAPASTPPSTVSSEPAAPSSSVPAIPSTSTAPAASTPPPVTSTPPAPPPPATTAGTSAGVTTGPTAPPATATSGTPVPGSNSADPTMTGQALVGPSVIVTTTASTATSPAPPPSTPASG
jgi:hypothetical protein